MGGEDYRPESTGAQTRDSLKAISAFGPGALSRMAQELRVQAPLDAALEASLASQFSPQLLGLGEDLADTQAQRTIGRDLQTIRGGGRELASEALSLDAMANPEFYGNRAAAGQGFQALIGGQDPNRLTGGEMANVERGVNRLNQTRGTPSSLGDATTTASNAMLFGDKLNEKRALFGQSLSLFPGIQQGSQSNIDAYQVASGRGATGTNASLNRMQGQQNLDANQFYGGLQQNVGNINQGRESILANRRTLGDRATQQYSAVTPCCFIFLEAYNGTLPESVRLCRDYYYQKNHQLSIGYKRMAKWLVPLMKSHNLIRGIVNKLMVQPMTRYGQWLTGNSSSYNTVDKMISKLWFNIWNTYAY